MKVQRTKKGNLVVRSKYDFNCAVIGMLLGDSWCNRTILTSKGPENRSKKGPFWNRTELLIEHKEASKEYLDWKIELIKAYLDDVTIYPHYKIIDNVRFDSYCAHLKHRKNFHYMYKNFYVGGHLTDRNRITGAKKIVKQSILNRLSPLSIAIWYMDDGSLHTYKRGEHVYRTLSLHTDGFTKDESIMISEYFDKNYGIKFNVNHNSTTPKDKDYGYKLRCHKRDDIDSFIDIVKFFVEDVKCMNYKLPL